MKPNKWFIFRLIATLIFWTVVFFPALFIPRRWQYKTLWPIFTKLFLFASKVRPHYLSKVDLNSKEPMIYAPNHKALVDTYIILNFIRRPFTILFKKEMNHNPLFKLMSWKMKLIPIDRKRTISQKEALEKIKKMISQNHSLVMFPEGWHIVDQKFGKFKRGIATVARETNVKIVPIAIYGIDNNFIYDKKVVWKDIYLKASEPIVYTDYKSEDDFLENLRKKIEKLYTKLENEYKV